MSQIKTYDGKGAQLASATVRDADYSAFLERLTQDWDVARIVVFRDGKQVAVLPLR